MLVAFGALLYHQTGSFDYIGLASVASTIILGLIYLQGWRIEEQQVKREQQRSIVEVRLKHYSSIREVISKLGALKVEAPGRNQISWVQLKLTLGIKDVVEVKLSDGSSIISPVYPSVETHLSHDLPKFLPALNEVGAEVETFNKKVDALESKTEDRFREELSNIAPLTSDYLQPNAIYFPTVQRWAQNTLFMFMSSYTPALPIGESFKRSYYSGRVEISTNAILLDNQLITTSPFSEKVRNSIAETLDKLIQDTETLEQLVELRLAEEALASKLQDRLRAHAGDVIQLLYRFDTNQYNSIYDCCPRE